MNTTAPHPAAPAYDSLPLPPDSTLRTLGDGTVIGRYLRMDLASVFQPIVAGSDGRIVGHEAFVRAHGRGDLSLTPWGLFSRADGGRALIALDRLCRLVHTLNFRRGQCDGLLFMNVHGRLLEAVTDDHGRAFREMLDRLEFPVRRVVIEIPHSANDNRRLLALAAANYRRNGFAVALNVRSMDTLGAVLRVVQADYVKIDTRGIATPDDLHLLAAALRNQRTRIVCTRVGTDTLRDDLRQLPGLLLQGHALAAPQALPLSAAVICL